MKNKMALLPLAAMVIVMSVFAHVIMEIRR